jgi:hypothetical protein
VPKERANKSEEPGWLPPALVLLLGFVFEAEDGGGTSATSVNFYQITQRRIPYLLKALLNKR